MGHLFVLFRVSLTIQKRKLCAYKDFAIFKKMAVFCVPRE